MILTLGDWKFDIRMEETMAYSAEEAKSHCDCAYCRNFYAVVDAAYPQLRPFLAQFGLDIEAPEELMPFDEGIYEATYAVNGEILQQGSRLEISGIPVDIDQDDYISTDCPKPYFTVGVGLLQLPWVLDEPAQEVVSPANSPSFLKKMWNKLLGRAEGTSKQ